MHVIITVHYDMYNNVCMYLFLCIQRFLTSSLSFQIISRTCRSNPAVAVSLRATPRRAALQHHSLGWKRRRIQTLRSRSSLYALGDKKTQTQHEL